MKISDFKFRLMQLQRDHGDVDIVVDGEYDWSEPEAFYDERRNQIEIR